MPQENLNITSQRALTLGSGCQFAFIKRQKNIIPVLILTGINREGIDGARVDEGGAQSKIGIIESQIDPNNKAQLKTNFITTPVTLSNKNSIPNDDWINLDFETDKIVYPRIFIKSLQVHTDSDSLVVKYEEYNQNQNSNKIVNYKVLTPYQDYSILTRSLNEEYVITLNPQIVIKNGIAGSLSGIIQPKQTIINYSISNADTSIYLDAIEVLKQNSQPKVSYEVKPNSYNLQYYNTLYNKLGNIVRINDEDLKFKNVRGYVSGLTLDLDQPENDSIEIKNYKTKFEDLFSTITAQTEQMKKNSGLFEAVSNAFTSSGELSEEVLQSSIMKVDLDYAFNNGKLTIDQHNGIWGTSDNGVVAFRGGGIFTSTQKDSEGNWKWNTGITPEGINANLITSGQLDTNLIKIYSGDNLRFQMNGDGIFAYKNKITYNKPKDDMDDILYATDSVDGKQYVVFNDEGISLIAKKGAMVLNSKRNTFKEVLSDEDCAQVRSLASKNLIKRVEIGWNGLVLRNWIDQDVFYADADTGNLTLKGHIEATSGHIGTWSFDNHKLWADSQVNQEGIYTTFVALNAGNETQLKNSAGESYIDITTNQPLRVNTGLYAFWAGSANPSSAPFSIQKNGKIKASSGTIGGWKITSNFLYANNTIVFAPTGQDSSTSIQFAILDEDGEQVFDENNKPMYTSFDLNGTVMWGPGPSGDTNELITNSLASAKFTLNKDGDLMVASLNGWKSNNFTSPKSPYIVIGSSQDGIRLLNMKTGGIRWQNFNTLNSATASWTIESASGVSSNSDASHSTRSQSFTIKCVVTSGSHTKTFSYNTTLSVTVQKSGDDGASATASCIGRSLSSGTLKISSGDNG